MKCITCLCVNDVEDENDTKCNHFIPCPQCLKLLYCSAAVINGTNSKTATTIADMLYISTSPVFTTMAQSPSVFTTFMEVEEQEWEDAFISEWESHLMERASTELNSNEKPHLPQKNPSGRTKRIIYQ
ncbi:hypothetical protein LSM04_000127 [Trypanosoma melophagium]|uniref:uncharacterized protein n=1 Tax=Trypanosoma melophagium TaxID=715481 RepID=UPI00351A0CA1|nr:hypothetical protein LSM04_000127 [Trypanosoma melophagium]